ncbi:MAG: type II toxin-antitoxin system PemK/MazF family toxin [Cyclobacteriaceae bacterium]|nr:type II toxin-antitoxin system PemK/MazF family toxin [Cyclobacteriaceae bacterium]
MDINQGDIVAVDFPFSDGSGIKRRPALVISNDVINKTGDVVLMQVTSKFKNDVLTIALQPKEISSPLPLQSFLRVHKLFTIDRKLVVKKLSKLNENAFDSVLAKLFEILK